jgi:restriction endonuclease Mrr
MLPLLQFAGDRQEHSLREAIDSLADHFGLSAVERKELLPSGQQEGREVLADRPSRVDVKFLERFDEFS